MMGGAARERMCHALGFREWVPNSLDVASWLALSVCARAREARDGQSADLVKSSFVGEPSCASESRSVARKKYYARCRPAMVWMLILMSALCLSVSWEDHARA